MKQQEAEQIYLHHVARTEELINSLGDNPQKINTYITNTYAQLAQENPEFLWFGLGAIISASVGRNIQMATQTTIHSADQFTSAAVILNNFSQGNQDIFKNILPIFLTYQTIGPENIKLLKTSELGINNPFKNEAILNILSNQSLLQQQQAEIAHSLELPLNDAKVIEQLFSDKVSRDLAHSIALGITDQEQKTAQLIYSNELLNIMLNPALGWVGHQAKLDEITVLDKTFNFFDYIDNPADIDQRMNFAEILLNAIEDGISQGELLQFQADIEKNANHTLWMSNPYNTSNTIGEINGAYWGNLADEHDSKVKDSILAFLSEKPAELINTDIAMTNPIDHDDLNIFPSIHSNENEIIKITSDPLEFFLANNPNYQVIANDITELWYDLSLMHIAEDWGTKLWNPVVPYLDYFTQIEIYPNDHFYLNNANGEVRGITFPFLYDTDTGIPLSMPLVDVYGHYDQTSTIETIYTNPQVFDMPSHPVWNNPYWNEVVAQAKEVASQAFLNAITNNFFDAALAPFPSETFYFSYNPPSSQPPLTTNDVFSTNHFNLPTFHDGTNFVGSSSINDGSTPMFHFHGSGDVYGYDPQGIFGCLNCSDDVIY